MDVSQLLFRSPNTLPDLYFFLLCMSYCNSTSRTLYHMDSITFSVSTSESFHLIVVRHGTCGNSSLKTPPIGFNKLSQHVHHCQAAAREQEEHEHQVEPEHAHNHAVHFPAALTPLTTTLTNILVWFHSVVFARVLIGGLHSKLSAVKAGVQRSWLWLFSVCI